MKLDTKPYKGARDFYPEEKQIQNYIFNTWRDVCESFGFEEYDAPFLEPFELYAAKSGEELVNNQLYSFTDKGDRKIAIRPEMTPSVSRMVAGKYQELTKPIKWFSIANFWRYEKPQKGRLREFYQLNADIFGVDNITADFEIIALNKAIMDKFGATNNMCEVRVSNRQLIDYIFNKAQITLPELKTKILKILDAKDKITKKEYDKKIDETGITKDQQQTLNTYLSADINKLKQILEATDTNEDTKGITDIIKLFEMLNNSEGFENVIFDPYIVRGLDYYDGMIFEQKDLAKDNNRSMFGGGRYNGLIGLFINEQVPAIGFAQGDVPLKLFLETWDLLPKFKNTTEYLVTIFPSDDTKKQLEFFNESQKQASILRKQGKNVEVYPNLNTNLSKQLSYANSKQIKQVMIIGEDEIKSEKPTIKILD